MNGVIGEREIRQRVLIEQILSKMSANTSV